MFRHSQRWTFEHPIEEVRSTFVSSVLADLGAGWLAFDF
jgi:hypothetical protein